MGLLIAGPDAVRPAREDLRTALQDKSPTVRIIAARALGMYGDQADLDRALAALAELAPPDKNGAYASILTLNTIDALGDKAAGLKPKLRGMPAKDPEAPGRANGYVSRLLSELLKGDGGPPAPRQKSKRSRKQ